MEAEKIIENHNEITEKMRDVASFTQKSFSKFLRNLFINGEKKYSSIRPEAYMAIALGIIENMVESLYKDAIVDGESEEAIKILDFLRLYPKVLTGNMEIETALIATFGKEWEEFMQKAPDGKPMVDLGL